MTQAQPYGDKENASRAAAPAEQFRAVLVKDPGLLVELERVVEREAVAKGQLVEDSDLTQQAIFGRLDDDLAFRATATRLVQGYGYLLPNVNPDSEIGKEQELVLKEWARRLVQIEAQEDEESLKPQKGEEAAGSASEADCNAENQTNCSAPVHRRSQRQIGNPPEIRGDSFPMPPGVNPAQILRSNADGTMKVVSVNLTQAIAGAPTENLILRLGDRVIVHRNTAKIEPSAIYVEGEVDNPGRYPLAANMSVQDLVRVAGGLKPSADSNNAILAHHGTSQPGAPEIETLNVNLGEAMAGHSGQNALLANRDVLTVRKSADWNDLGATVTIRGEVEHPGTYGIRPGEALSSVLAKAGGFNSQAYPYGTVLTRKEVRDLELQSHHELVARVKAEETQLKAVPENDTDQKNLKLTALAQNETALTQMETHLPVRRVVLRGAHDGKSFDAAADGRGSDARRR